MAKFYRWTESPEVAIRTYRYRNENEEKKSKRNDVVKDVHYCPRGLNGDWFFLLWYHVLVRLFNDLSAMNFLLVKFISRLKD